MTDNTPARASRKRSQLGPKLLALAALIVAAILSTGETPAKEGFTPLNLKPIANMDWRDEVWGDGKGGWTDQGDNDLRQVEVGTRELLGIPFELIDPAANGGKAVLTLGSKKFPAGPTSASSPSMARPGASISSTRPHGRAGRWPATSSPMPTARASKSPSATKKR